MKKVMRVVAVALMLAGTTAFASEDTCKGKKAECKKGTKTECTQKSKECSKATDAKKCGSDCSKKSEA